MTYALDLTASLAANYITTTFERPASGVWLFKMPGGSFYTKDLKLTNTYNGKPLEPLTQFRVLDFNADASTEAGGKEVCDIIYISDNTISEVTVKRRVIGGVYEVIGTDVDKLVADGKINATTATTWGQVINAPVQFPPEIHEHYTESVYGLEHAIYATNKIADGVTSGDAGLFGALQQYVDLKIADAKTAASDKLATLSTLVDNSKDIGKMQVNQVVIFTDNSNPATVFKYGRWERLPDGLLMMTSDNALVGTSKKVGEGTDYIGTYYAAWRYLGD